MSPPHHPIFDPEPREPTDGAFAREELRLANRNAGTLLESLRHDVTPPGLHYLLTHFDVRRKRCRARRRQYSRARAAAEAANGGLIVTASALALHHHNLIITLAARHKLPAVYFARYFVISGGLISYGVDPSDQYRLVAGYVDRILKGAKPADLPVQAPTKYELVINLKTAKALGLEVPPTLLARTDEAIE
jgi:hypothetical protein